MILCQRGGSAFSGAPEHESDNVQNIPGSVSHAAGIPHLKVFRGKLKKPYLLAVNMSSATLAQYIAFLSVNSASVSHQKINCCNYTWKLLK